MTAPLDLFDIKVVFADGESYVPVNRRLVFNDTTPQLIALPGTRAIRKVEFTFQRHFGNLAEIEMWARP